jgi:hypothetical protein
MHISRRIPKTIGVALVAFLAVVFGVNYGASMVFATEAHMTADTAIPCGATVGTIDVDLWATNHGDTAVVTEAWGLAGIVKGHYLGRVLAAIETTDTPAQVAGKHDPHTFPNVAPGTYTVGVTLTFSSGFVSTDERTVIVPPSAVCPDTSTTVQTTPTTVTSTTTTDPTSTTLPASTTTVSGSASSTVRTSPDGTISGGVVTLPRTGAGGGYVPWAAGAVMLGVVLVGLTLIGRRPECLP